MIVFADLEDDARALVSHCTEAGLRLVTAESCTGGLVAAAITEIPGASAVFDRGFITYADKSKVELLSVSSADIERFGVVSEEVARAMAEGALARATVDLAVAVTGIAGPGGGTPQKPVGLVHFATARTGSPTRHRSRSFGDLGRSQIRLSSVREALALLLRHARD